MLTRRETLPVTKEERERDGIKQQSTKERSKAQQGAIKESAFTDRLMGFFEARGRGGGVHQQQDSSL